MATTYTLTDTSNAATVRVRHLPNETREETEDRAQAKLLKANGGYTYVDQGGWYYERRERRGMTETSRVSCGCRNPVSGEWSTGAAA